MSTLVNSGPVTQYLLGLLTRQLDEAGVVVWFDPAHDYADLAAALSLPATTVLRFDGSFFALRRAAYPLLAGDRPRLIVYVPLREEDTLNALVEMTSIAAVMKPGQSSRQRNTRLAVVARAALAPHFAEGQLAEVVSQIEAGKLKLHDLDHLATSGPSVLSVIFGTDDQHELVLRFFDSNYDAAVLQRGALPDLASYLQARYGFELPDDASTEEMRVAAARQILVADLLTAWNGDPPAHLAPLATNCNRDACAALAGAWRRDRMRRERYALYAERAENDLDLGSLPAGIDQARDVETFLATETKLQEAIEAWLAQADSCRGNEAAGYRSLIERRLHDFWSSWPERFDAVRPRWEILLTILNLLAEAERIDGEVRAARSTTPADLIRCYALHDAPWCSLDTLYRRLEQYLHTYDLPPSPSLTKATNRARSRYTAIGGDLAERFSAALEAAKFRIPGILQQRQIYPRRVLPAVDEGKTAYILVDALRFEMAWEVRERLDAEYDVSLDAAIGTPPSLTPIGMGALMPGADGAAGTAAVGTAKIGFRIGEGVLATRKDRLSWFAGRHPSAVTVTLGEILPSAKSALDAKLREAPLILVTSQEIDALAEGDNLHQTWLFMDHLLRDLGRLINRLRDYGCRTIVIAADHGYLFSDELDTGMKIDPPSGKGIDLHRRVWIGSSAAPPDGSYLRAPLAAFGQESDLHIACPRGFGAFKVQGGARAYFHGGLSLQELAVPVMIVRPKGGPAEATPGDLAWTLTAGSRRVSTRFFAVTIGGESTGLLPIEKPPLVRLELRAGNETLSRTERATYGFSEATGDVALRHAEDNPHAIDPVTVTLHVNPRPGLKSVSAHLIDAATGRELARLDAIPVSIQEY